MSEHRAEQAHQEPPSGTRFECGAHFFQGILVYEGTRWLIFPSAAEYQRYDAGDLGCIRLRPERGEFPRVIGDRLFFAQRYFYRDPVLKWTDQPPPPSLKTYLQSPKFRRYVRLETEVETDVRTRFERTEGYVDLRSHQAQMTEIPEHLWARIAELAPTKSSEQIAAELSTPECPITYGAVDRLKRHFIRKQLWQAQEVDLKAQVAADQESMERELALAKHLLEQSTDRIVRQCPHEGAELRKNALVHFEMAKFSKKCIDSNSRKLEDIALGQQTEDRKFGAPPADPRDRELAELRKQLAELKQEVQALKEGPRAEPAPAPEPTRPVEAPKPASPQPDGAASAGDVLGFEPIVLEAPKATSSPPGGHCGAR